MMQAAAMMTRSKQAEALRALIDQQAHALFDELALQAQAPKPRDAVPPRGEPKAPSDEAA